MSGKREFLKHTAIFGIGSMVGQLVPFILFPLYTNYLTAAEYGTLDIIQQTSDIINTVFLIGGIRLAVMTFFKQAENEEARKKIAATFSLLLWTTVAAAVGTAVLFADYLELFLKTGNTRLLSFGLSVSLLDALVAVPLTLTQARLESLRFVLTNIVIQTSRLCLCIYFVAVLRWNVWGILYAQCIVCSVSAVLLTYRELRIGSFYPDLSHWKEIVRFVIPLVPNGIIAFFYGMMGRFFIIHSGYYKTDAEAMAAVGMIAIAGRLIALSRCAGIGPLQTVWNVQRYDIYASRSDAGFVFGNFFLRLLCVQVFAGFLLSVFAAECINIVCGDSYRGAAALIPLCAVSSCLALFTNYAASTFFITRHTHINFYCNIIMLLGSAFFMQIFVPAWGMLGAAAAVIPALGMYGFAVYFMSQRCFRIRYPFQKMFLLAAVTLFCYGLSLCCGSGFDTSETYLHLSKWERVMSIWGRIQWLPVLAKSGIVLLWFGIIWCSDILSADDKQIVFRIGKALRNRLRK